VGGNEHVHGGEGAALFPRHGAKVGVGFCSGGVPGQDADAQEELIDEFGELCGLGFRARPKSSSASVMEEMQTWAMGRRRKCSRTEGGFPRRA